MAKEIIENDVKEVKEEAPKKATKKKRVKNEAGAKTIHVKCKFISPILGSAPSDKDVYSTYIASKTPNNTDDELESIDATDDEVSEKVTIFHKSKSGAPFMYDYMIKGFFKNACHACREVVGSVSSDLSAYKTKIDNLIFPVQRYIKFENASEITLLQRPLRAQTAQGPRVALSSSEMIQPGCTIEFDLDIKDANLYPYVIEWLEYGKVNGFGQWHNGGYGRFCFAELDSEGNKIYGNIEEADKLIEEYFEFEGM